MNSVQTDCGCTITTRSGKTVTCKQTKANGKSECYYHAKCIEGLCAPSKVGDVNEGGGVYSRDDEVASIKSMSGRTVHYR